MLMVNATIFMAIFITLLTAAFVFVIGPLLAAMPILRVVWRVWASRSARRYEEWERWMLTNDCNDTTALGFLGPSGMRYVKVAKVMPLGKIRQDIETWESGKPRLSRKKFVSRLAEMYGVGNDVAKRRLREVEIIMFAGGEPW